MKNFFIATILMSMGFCSATYSANVPRSVAADHHVKLVQYDPHNVVLLKGHYGYQTQISFAPNEIIQNVAIGDSMAWLAVPVHHHLFVKPVTESTTNMAVLTNRHSYNFELDSSSKQDGATYQLTFTYPEDHYAEANTVNTAITFDPDKLNWRYSFTGFRSLAPIAAFDNGQFTYFKFKHDGMSHLPSVFIVDKHRHESLVNYHMQGEYMVINHVAKQFTLRDGDYITSIYNDFAINNDH